MKKIIGVLLFLLFCRDISELYAEDLSLYLIPSEDELQQLLVTGEINYEQYQRGLEVLNLYRFDNSFSVYDFYSLTRFDYQTNDLFSEGETGQVDLLKDEKRYFLKGSLSHSYASEIKKRSRSRYRSSVKLALKERYRFNLKIQKEYSGRERITYRNFVYTPNNKYLKQLTVGNYSKKLGLGGGYGYRGKLFDYSAKIDDESLLYPDYGGFNGYFLETSFKSIQLDQLTSFGRDSANSIFTSGAHLRLKVSPVEPYLIFGYTKLTNRNSSASISNMKIATGLKIKYNKSYTALEIVTQTEYQSGLSAILGEGMHRFENGNIKYAFWLYAADYLDFTGGGKSAYLTSHVELDTLDYQYSDRRAGQTGGSVRTTVLLTPKVQWSNAVLLGAQNSDSLNVQFQSELGFKLTSCYQLNLKHLQKHKKRIEDSPPTSNRTDSRLELTYRSKKINWRTYLGYGTKDEAEDYLSFFLNFRFQTERLGQFQFWGNIYQLQTDFEDIDYWYCFIKNEIKLYENWFSSVKLSHSYDRRSDNKDITVFAMEIIRVL